MGSHHDAAAAAQLRRDVSKPLLVMFAAMAFVVVAFVVRVVIDTMPGSSGSRVKAVPVENWVTESVDNMLTVELPFHLERQTLHLPAILSRVTNSVTFLGHEEDGLAVVVGHLTFNSPVGLKLDQFADNAVEELRNMPGNVLVDLTQQPTSVDGMRGIELQTRITRSRGAPQQLRGVVFIDGVHVYQVMYYCGLNQDAGGVAWKRIRDSIKKT